VNHIITGGSADRSGIIQLGDIVVSVDSRDVRGKVSPAPTVSCFDLD
jgi:C-terminal processing protease CtpA/Prc